MSMIWILHQKNWTSTAVKRTLYSILPEWTARRIRRILWKAISALLRSCWIIWRSMIIRQPLCYLHPSRQPLPDVLEIANMVGVKRLVRNCFSIMRRKPVQRLLSIVFLIWWDTAGRSTILQYLLSVGRWQTMNLSLLMTEISNWSFFTSTIWWRECSTCWRKKRHIASLRVLKRLPMKMEDTAMYRWPIKLRWVK